MGDDLVAKLRRICHFRSGFVTQPLNTRSPCALTAGPHVASMPDAIPPEAETVVLFKDGSAWLAVRQDFQDVQSGLTGTGETPGRAVDHLLAQEQASQTAGLRFESLTRDGGHVHVDG